ncbi:MAG: hypothetical protein IPK19_30625 [Chloroflexi bacterium]|nr:hypothetical protein [Chloroflexota bacterium]
MNNSGSNDPALTGAPPGSADSADGQPASPRSRFPSVTLILLVGIALTLAAYIGVNVLGVLVGILAPPLPPVPAGLTEIDHVNEAYGVDIWTYTSPADPCEIVTAFEETGFCTVAPLQCGELRTEPDQQLETSLAARCAGEVEFSIFTMQWWARIFQVNADRSTRLELEREVFWIGDGERQIQSR